MFKKVLIANRGEIALRIIRACRELGVKSVVAYSQADRESLPVRLADEAVCIGPAASERSYRNVPAVIQAAAPDRLRGDPPRLRLPGRERRLRRDRRPLRPGLRRAATGHDRADGQQVGGARGDAASRPAGAARDATGRSSARRRRSRPRVRSATRSCSRRSPAAAGAASASRATSGSCMLALPIARSEAQAAFGNGDVYLEKFLEQPRHIEVQILGDAGGGHVVSLGERECSLQRRLAEGHRGGAGRRRLRPAAPRPGRRRREGGAGDPLRQRRHLRVPGRSRRPLLLPGSQHPHPGRARRDRGGHRRRPGQVAVADGGRAAADRARARHQDDRPRHRVPHQRREPGARLRARGRPHHRAVAARRARRPRRYATSTTATSCRPTTTRSSPR